MKLIVFLEQTRIHHFIDLDMTQEEKAKAYDEALKKIKVLQEDWKSTHNRAWKEIEEVFPQLCESEDERIAEELIKALRGISTGLQYAIFLTEEKKQRWIAWLEKQKGQNLIMANSPQLKEQKPVEWSEEDEWMKESIISTLMANMQFTYQHDPLGQADHKKKITWLKSLSLKKRLDDVDKLCSNKWNEEDEACLNQLICFCEHCMVQDSEVKKCTKWLKSLRPNWKPSEEQMKALKDALETYKGFEEYDAMESLYNDLQTRL